MVGSNINTQTYSIGSNSFFLQPSCMFRCPFDESNEVDADQNSRPELVRIVSLLLLTALTQKVKICFSGDGGPTTPIFI